MELLQEFIMSAAESGDPSDETQVEADLTPRLDLLL